jgi:amino-acid N-acetyltransferase
MIRKALITDVPSIQGLITPYAEKGEMLPRSLNDLYDNLRDFFVFEEGDAIVGVCALHISWEDLAEIRSLVVQAENTGRRIGGRLIAACLDEARELKVKRVFALTYIPEYFERHCFRQIDKATLPHKIWHDCLNCVKFPNCDEQAVIVEIV